RPRDLMTLGERLATLRPDERRNEHRLKEAVNQAAAEIAQEYLVEIAPYMAGLDLTQLIRRLPGHILTRQEIERIFQEHATAAGAGHGERRRWRDRAGALRARRGRSRVRRADASRRGRADPTGARRGGENVGEGRGVRRDRSR